MIFFYCVGGGVVVGLVGWGMGRITFLHFGPCWDQFFQVCIVWVLWCCGGGGDGAYLPFGTLGHVGTIFFKFLVL